MNGLQKTVQLSLLVLAVLASARFAGAQVPADSLSSIGFAHPDSTQPVRAYRLPTWHWSTWTLRANGNAVRRSSSRDDLDLLGSSSDRDADQFDLNLGLNPIYRSFWESEARRAFLRLSPSLALSRSGITSSTEGQEQKRDDTAVSGQIDLRGRLREYVSGQAFLLASVNGSAIYNYLRSVEDGVDETQDYLDGRATVRLGVGVGRVRIVTPVIRALRVRERLRTVAPGTSVSDEQVQTAARQLARRPGYQAVYDRPDKYFWSDFFDRVGLTGHSPFETFYVADVLRELVGVRREGAEFAVGALGSHEGGEDQVGGRNVAHDDIDADALGGFARGQWYRNLALNHQLGVNVRATYRHFVDSQGPLDNEVGIDAEGQWLWVLADRLRLDTRLRADLLFQNDPRGEEKFRPLNRYALTSDLLLFIENSLSLRAGAHIRSRFSAIRSEYRQLRFSTGLQFSVEYVLSRALR